jgi:CheY-like chemotaxis protein
LAKIRKQKFDLVTLDNSMPDVDGLDVLKQIRAERRTCRC